MDDAGHAVIAFIFLFYAAYDLAFTPLIVSYTVEILPYALRAKGFTIFNFTISLALIFNQYVNPVALGTHYYSSRKAHLLTPSFLLEAISWKYYIVYVVWLLFEIGFLYLYVVETRGRSLEETAALFDGMEAENALADAAAAAIHGTTGVGHDSDSEKKDGSSIQHLPIAGLNKN